MIILNIKEVILENSNLIYSIARKFDIGNIDDLFQAGCIGMIEAYKRFDENKNVKFTTYAYPFILGRISQYARENHTICLSKDMLRMKNKINKVKDYLTQEFMREPSEKELSDYLNIPIDDLKNVMNYQSDGLSLDDVYLDNLSLYDVIESKQCDYSSLIYLKSEIENLGEPERSILIKRYFEDMTQCETASLLGLTQVDVSRREKKALVKLRQMSN